MAQGWYTEKWKVTGKKAYCHATLDTFDAVRAIIKARPNDEIVRVRAPVDASDADLEELIRLGAERLF